MHPIGQAIIKTICYADIFDFPLTEPEIHQKLISSQKISPSIIQDHLAILIRDSKIKLTTGYYHLPGREDIVNLRSHRTKISAKKYSQAKKIFQQLIRLPFIRAVFLTGTLAVSNASQGDDVDIMVITAQKSLFTGRFFVNLWLELHHQRRRPEDSLVADKICPNLFLTENSLLVPKNQQNLYTAHEVIQALPVADPYHYHDAFLKLNSWAYLFLANSHPGRKYRKLNPTHFHAPAILESIMRQVQLAYMKPKRTREIITHDAAYFHPRDTGSLVLEKFNHTVENNL